MNAENQSADPPVLKCVHLGGYRWRCNGGKWHYVDDRSPDSFELRDGEIQNFYIDLPAPAQSEVPAGYIVEHERFASRFGSTQREALLGISEEDARKRCDFGSQPIPFFTRSPGPKQDADTVPKHKFDALVEDYKRLQSELKEVQKIPRLHRLADGRDYWGWMGDGSDHLESMSSGMAVLIRAADLRAFISTQSPARPWVVADGGTAAGEHKYRTLRQGVPEWTLDSGEALQFFRREDAELFAEEDEDAWRIIQVPAESPKIAARALTSTMLKAVIDNPLTSIDDDDARHARIGWFTLAWEIAHEAAAPQPKTQTADIWCMCTKLKLVARDGRATCSICGGRDAYGKSLDRPENRRKILDGASPKEPNRE